jgi:serine/threonine protein kinase
MDESFDLLDYFESIFSTIMFLHSHQIQVRTFNFETIFFDLLNNPRLYCCLVVSIPNVGFEGGTDNIRFSAPEVLLRSEFSEKSDVWSFGCLYYFLKHEKYPFDGNDEGIKNHILFQKMDFVDNFLKGSLERSRSKRFTIEELLEVYNLQSDKVQKKLL